MACRPTAIITICALAVLAVACADEATEQTGDSVTVVEPATSDLVTTPAPETTPTPATTMLLETAAVSDVTAQLREVVEAAVRESASIPGLVLHVEAPDRELGVSVAAGVADRVTSTPLTPDAGFRIASNTKTFVAAAILRLVEQEKISLDAPIAEFLSPETDDALRAGGYRTDTITVRNLLVHTGGVYDYGQDPDYQAAVNAEPSKRWTRLEQVRFAMEHGAPVGEPGAVYAYSDTGYILLGEMLERASGQPLAEAYRTLLDFEGLHLDATYVESLEPTPPGIAARAHQYVGDVDGFDLDPSFDLYGAAGLVSTVDDLSRFYRALLRGEVFTEPETLATMLEIPASNTESRAGMGIFEIDVFGHTCWSHSGFWGTFVVTCPQIDVTIAASWNQAMPAPEFNSERVLGRAFELATTP